ncbi:MAG: CBS domain-containing protein [Chloroflexi bacterium]|nr:CBS domain-containing protein [Chloroflexota bacterium]
MRARRIMSTTLFTVARLTPVRDVIRLLIEQRISGVPVVDDGRVVGIISEGDLILRERAYRQRGGMAFLAQQLFEDHEKQAVEFRKAHGLVAEDVMSEPVVTILPGTPVEEIAHLMAERQIKRVPVVEDGRLVGIVSRGDVLRAAYERELATENHAGGPHSDQEIVSRLLTVLRSEPWVEVSHIRPSCLDGCVTLSGEVESEAEREAVEVAARGVAGVRAVTNALIIRPGIDDE